MTTDNGLLTTLQLQNARIINIQRFSISEDRNDYPQPNRSFSGGHCHHNENKELAGDVLKETRKSYKRQIHSVEHQLDAHEHRNHISLDDYADHSNREEHSR